MRKPIIVANQSANSNILLAATGIRIIFIQYLVPWRIKEALMPIATPRRKPKRSNGMADPNMSLEDAIAGFNV